MHKKIIFIDRDGVINWDPIGDYIKRPQDFRFLPGVGPSLKRLTQSGFTIIIISNQAGVGDGVFSKEDLDRVHGKFLADTELAGSRIDKAYYCLHGKQAGCSCRKPETGLFEMAHKEIGDFNKGKTFYIGDKISDIEAGRRYGLRTIMVLTGHGEKEREKIQANNAPDLIADDLACAVEMVLEESDE